MLFNSVVFIAGFLPVTFALYFMLLQKRMVLGAKALLTAASLFFYAYWKIEYLPIILTSIVFNFVIGSAIAKDNQKVRVNRKTLLVLGIVANILLLAYFKYTDFFIFNINYIFNSEFSLLHIVLPLAISFFTFQQIAYLVDSYHGYTKEYDFLSYALFVSFFPQLIAGPIVHHKELLPQFAQSKNLVINYRNIASGIMIFLIGLFKKIMIADTFSQYVAKGFGIATELNMAEAWFTSLSYTMQIYYDFSGYCDMAMGAALMFNIRLPINFNSPYKAINIQDFWRRWHITLSRFLRDYIYIPLGGSRVSPLRNYYNLAMVFIIGGFWHGASWTFVVWGILHACATIIHRLWQFTKIKMPKFLAWFITFNFINITWIFFRAENFQTARTLLKKMFCLSSISNLETYKIKMLLSDLGCRSKDLEFLILALFCVLIFKNSNELLLKFSIKNDKQSYVWGVVAGVVLTLLIAKIIFIPYSEFIYFNF